MSVKKMLKNDENANKIVKNVSIKGQKIGQYSGKKWINKRNKNGPIMAIKGSKMSSKMTIKKVKN